MDVRDGASESTQELTGAGNRPFGVEPGDEFGVRAIARSTDGASSELGRNGGRDRAEERRVVERLCEEVSAIRKAQGAANAALAAQIERLDLIQTRIEATLSRLEPPASAPNVVLWLAVSTAAVSVALGGLSLVWP